MIPISGHTRLLPIIGRPIEQVKSPEFFNRYFAENEIDAVTTAHALSDAAADAFIESIRGCDNAAGFVATIPHKQRSAAACDELSDRAAFLGAANLIRREPDGRLVGDMSDGFGCIQAMRTHGCDPKGKRALVVGTGGAGSAIAHSLAEAGVARLTLTDLDQARLEALAEKLAAAFPGLTVATGTPDMADVDIAANASPVGMNGDPNLPLPLAGIKAGTLVSDVVTNPETTPWLKTAAGFGCVTQTGRDMVQGQFGLMTSHFRFT